MIKIDQIILLIKEIVLLILGKFHNRITGVIVTYGGLLIFGSQINLMMQIVIVKISPWVDIPPENLISFFTIDPKPEMGLTLVFVALVYNFGVTVCLAQIQSYKAKHPKLELAMLNGDKEKIGGNHTLRGAICTHSIDEIPDNTSYSERALEEKKRNGRLFTSQINKNFYRERAKYLSSQGGMEIIGLTLENLGATLASNARVELRFKKSAGVSASNENSPLLMPPSQETKEDDRWRSNDNAAIYDIKARHTSSDSDYFFEWIAGNLQPKQLCESKTRIFFRTESDIDINVKIYCDELPDPIEKSYKIKPTAERFEFDLDLLKYNDKDFSDATSKKIMDGQQIRYINKSLS
ncbi:hypothetical protein [Methylobacter tundripaludum]|uniref:Uncharacterized protein n=1 Tax=Methylobacter tundripaludum (strain ATCC BAA-1195 / DSM 17260 / SV96) TaxID=697282 RepID=G3J2B2_METTV|nr:hypothetical protein [Methylobacter tundripaludum]EGW19868.1 hypothetical protein Mettu_2988 [Methylobacter tundripaludum SV96]